MRYDAWPNITHSNPLSAEKPFQTCRLLSRIWAGPPLPHGFEAYLKVSLGTQLEPFLQPNLTTKVNPKCALNFFGKYEHQGAESRRVRRDTSSRGRAQTGTHFADQHGRDYRWAGRSNTPNEHWLDSPRVSIHGWSSWQRKRTCRCRGFSQSLVWSERPLLLRTGKDTNERSWRSKGWVIT